MAKVVIVAPHLRPTAVVQPAVPAQGAGPSPLGALRILAGIKGKKMASGGLDDDAPPLYAAYMASEHHMNKGGDVDEYAKGGEVDADPEDDDFLEPASRLDPEMLGSPEGLNSLGSTDEGEDMTGEGDHMPIVRAIFAALKARGHVGR